MRVLVTGGAGFIGSHIVDQILEQGHQPYVIDNLSSGQLVNLPSSVRLFVADIRDEAALRQAFDEVRPQAVCHQAAQMSVSHSVREPAFDAQVNIVGLLNVLQQSARVGVERVVFASSGGVLYGDVSEPAREDFPCQPISPYGISKWAGEQYLEFFVREAGMQGVALRYSNVYGPRQNPHGEAGVVAIFCRRMLGGEAATINGDGRYIRDYVYGPDVARANLLALTADLPAPFVAFNVGTGVGTDVNVLAARLHELASEARRATGRNEDVPVAVRGPSRAGDLRSNLVCPDAIDQALGWQPKVSLEEGLERTMTWFAQQTFGETLSGPGKAAGRAEPVSSAS